MAFLYPRKYLDAGRLAYYFAVCKRLKGPLTQHNCLNIRLPTYGGSFFAEVADMYPACLIGSGAVALMGIRTHRWSH